MTNLDNILKTLAIITAIVVAIGGLLAAILEVLGKLKQVWEILKPSIKYLAFLGSQIIPNGAIMWIFLYRAAENSNRLAEPQVFLLLVGEATIVLSRRLLGNVVLSFPPTTLVCKARAKCTVATKQ
jgi:hypothetical protein